MVAFVNL